MKKLLPLIAITACSFAEEDRCAPTQPMCYTQDSCKPCYCLGPADIITNAPVRPVTCDGDISITVAGLYWKANQDGMEYAVDTAVFVDSFNSQFDLREPNHLIDAEYLYPKFSWNFGFKLGARYSSPCDGWDIGLLWTHFDGRASSHVEAERSDNHTILALWSAFQSLLATGGPFPGPSATDIETHWKLNLNLLDLDLGREFWVSKYLSLRPGIGLRFASIQQNYLLEHKGGEFTSVAPAFQPDLNDEVHLKNDYSGAGILASLDTNWNFGCGWSLFGNMAASIVYGRFNTSHNEWYREALSPFAKTTILETENRIRASRAMLDLAFGVEYSALVCDCKYGLTARLGWEQHIFFHQNQLWRVVRTGTRRISTPTVFPNNLGENAHYQRRGDLSTQGLTLTFRFDF